TAWQHIGISQKGMGRLAEPAHPFLLQRRNVAIIHQYPKPIPVEKQIGLRSLRCRVSFMRYPCQFGLHLSQADLPPLAVKVEIDDQLVIKKIDGVDKAVDNLLLYPNIFQVQVLEL